LSRDKSTNFYRISKYFNKFLQKDINIFSNRFKMFNLDFFYLDILDNYRLDNIIFVYKKTIYREVFIFVERVNNYIYIVNKVVVRDNLSLYFCNSIII
jgi:hypothetical protein